MRYRPSHALAQLSATNQRTVSPEATGMAPRWAIVDGARDAAHFQKRTGAGIALFIFAGIAADILARRRAQHAAAWRGRRAS